MCRLTDRLLTVQARDDDRATDRFTLQTFCWSSSFTASIHLSARRATESDVLLSGIGVESVGGSQGGRLQHGANERRLGTDWA